MLRRIFLLPYELVTSPGRVFSSIAGDSARGRALLLGIPAVFVGVLSVGAYAWAEFGNKEELEKRYNAFAERKREENINLVKEINRKRQIAMGTNASAQDPVPEEDPLNLELREVQDAERTYLEKLISLDKENPEYKFRLGELALQQKDVRRCLALMKAIAPEEEPQYAKAHYWMARFLMMQPVQTVAEAKANILMAIKHVDHCLLREKNNRAAKHLKAQLLARTRRFVEAYEVFDDLFEENPAYYRQLVQINYELKREHRNPGILDQALIRFRDKVKEGNSDSQIWVRDWRNLIDCLLVKMDFGAAEQQLLTAIDDQSSEQAEIQDKSRVKFLKDELSKVYAVWASSLSGPDVSLEDRQRQFELAKKAFEYNPKNSNALRLFARFGAMPEFAVAAKAIYNAEEDEDAPADVLQDMGTRALQEEQWERARELLEKARKRAPNAHLILNNLAVAYTSGENRNPERALYLVDQALSLLPQDANRALHASHLFDTRGTALMQLNRMDEAAAAFEVALQVRPTNEKIIEKLVECYEGRDDRQADVYRRKLEEIRSGLTDEESGDDAGTNSESGDQ